MKFIRVVQREEKSKVSVTTRDVSFDGGSGMLRIETVIRNLSGTNPGSRSTILVNPRQMDPGKAVLHPMPNSNGLRYLKSLTTHYAEVIESTAESEDGRVETFRLHTFTLPYGARWWNAAPQDILQSYTDFLHERGGQKREIPAEAQALVTPVAEALRAAVGWKTSRPDRKRELVQDATIDPATLMLTSTLTKRSGKFFDTSRIPLHAVDLTGIYVERLPLKSPDHPDPVPNGAQVTLSSLFGTEEAEWTTDAGPPMKWRTFHVRFPDVDSANGFVSAIRAVHPAVRTVLDADAGKI